MTKPGKPPKLTERQRRFVEAYVECGNAAAAARRAGFKTRANVTGSRLLKHPVVAAAVLARSDELANASAASARERQQFWTAAMRGEIKDLTPERLRAAELLGKAQGDFIDRRLVRKHVTTGVIDYKALFKSQARADESSKKLESPAVIDATPAPVAASEPASAQDQAEPAPRRTSPPQLRLAQPDSLAAAMRDADRRVRDVEEVYRKLGL